MALITDKMGALCGEVRHGCGWHESPQEERKSQESIYLVSVVLRKGGALRIFPFE